MVAIVSNKKESIFKAVADMYTDVAAHPGKAFHFPTGRPACELVGYPAAPLDRIPRAVIESFAGVGYPFAAGVIRSGDVVLDVGSGSGTDAVLSSALAGPQGKVFALDMTPAMVDKLRRNVDLLACGNIEAICGNAESIPLPDASVDVVTSNGALNLVPDKARAFSEIFRVLKPGGRLQVADIALAQPVAERYRRDPQMWAECVVGAVEEERYLSMLRHVGFQGVERLSELDYFALSSSDTTRSVARLFNAHSIVLRAVKPLAGDARLPAPLGRAAAELGKGLAGVGVAVFAWLACAGAPAVLAALGAIGARSLATHAYMFPIYAAFIGFSVWLLWRAGRVRGEMRPFWLAVPSGALAIGATWIALLGLAPGALALWSYAGIAGVVGASVWSFLATRRPGNCLDEMIRDAQLRERRGSLARRRVNAAVAAGLILVSLYGMYWSIHTAGVP
jgi:SAM-dependent methyltransferase